MDRLRGIFEDMGLADVETFIASGNVIFRAAPRSVKALEARIEAGLREALGFEVETMLRSDAELAEVEGRSPFREAPGSPLYVGFLKEAPAEGADARLAALSSATDELRVDGRELYWLAHKSIADSPITAARLERALGKPATLTVRNITTVRKLVAKYPAAAGGRALRPARGPS